MIRRRTPPPGYEALSAVGASFWCDPAWSERLRAAGFHEAEGWTTRLDRKGAGRGAHGRWSPPDGGSDLFLKSFRRGGAVAALEDRFAGPSRFVRSLRAATLAAERGVATPRPRALWFERRGIGDWRGFLALDWLDGETWGAALERRPQASAEGLHDLAAAIVRMHEAGVFHADLNIDNLLLAADGVRVLDLDGSRVGSPVEDRGRATNLARLERSYRKRFGRPGPLPGGFDAVWQAYRTASGGRPDRVSERHARRRPGRRRRRL